MRIARMLAAPLLAACLLAACGNDKAGQRPSSAPAASENAPPAETELTLTGGAAFQGPTPVHCALSGPAGVQINFRTGDPDTPTVAVRVDDYRGGGPYAARVFVTGRSATGGLVTSTGEAHLEMRQSAPSPGGAIVQLSGKLDGSYQGDAGRGSIAGRFGSCAYSQDRNTLLQEAAGTALVPARAAGDVNQPAGDAEETETLAKAGEPAKADAETLPAPPPPRAVKAPKATRAAGTAGRPHRRAHRVAHRRHR